MLSIPNIFTEISNNLTVNQSDIWRGGGLVNNDQLFVVVFSRLPDGVPSHLHHVHLDLLANHLHQTNDTPEGG